MLTGDFRLQASAGLPCYRTGFLAQALTAALNRADVQPEAISAP